MSPQDDHHHHHHEHGGRKEEEEEEEEKEDDHQQHDDIVMPGFRFHPTEEELVDFYLRRKVEGKRFIVELITFLPLYHYDPWELPAMAAMAAIGEKEWFFYVPRDRKYRNGDRPNRVTTSGYWKATGADRIVRRTDDLRSIGLKKTLVFYSGKAPRGIRTGWIMTEYRLPPHVPQRLHKAEISLCRVYKRAGGDPPLPRSLPTMQPSSSSSSSRTSPESQKNSSHSNVDRLIKSSPGHRSEQPSDDKGSENSTFSTTIGIGLAPSTQSEPTNPTGPPLPIEHHRRMSAVAGFTPSPPPAQPSLLEDFHRSLCYQAALTKISYHHDCHPSLVLSADGSDLRGPAQSHPVNVPSGYIPASFSDRLIWDWNFMMEEKEVENKTLSSI